MTKRTPHTKQQSAQGRGATEEQPGNGRWHSWQIFFSESIIYSVISALVLRADVLLSVALLRYL